MLRKFGALQVLVPGKKKVTAGVKWLARIWFPLAATALVLLSLPGLALFGLHVAGYENTVNEYLELNHRLSFHQSLPEWAAGLLLALPPILILLYFLKLKRKPLAVPSTFLWKKSIEDLHVNSLFQWLRQNMLLLLQLLAILGLIYAILAPKFFARSGQGGRFVILVDNSASMNAADVAPSRLESAKTAALAEIESAGDSDAGMIIAFNSAAEIRQSFTSDKQLLRAAVRGIEPTHRSTRIEEALALADSLANPTRSTEDVSARPEGATRTYVPLEGVETALHLFSDGRFPDAPEFSTGNLRVQFHSAGKPGPDVNNVGIVNLSAARDETDPSRLQVFVRVQNFAPKSARAKVEIQAYVEGKLERAYDKSADLRGRIFSPAKQGESGAASILAKDEPGEAVLTFDVPEVDDRQEVVIRARLMDQSDIFPEDDAALLVVGVVRKARVLVVGPPNPILSAFFDDGATRSVVDMTRLTKEEMAERSKYLTPAQRGDYDLVIFDRCAPGNEDAMPQANSLFLGQPPPPWKPLGQAQPEGKSMERVDQPAVKGWTAQHGLLKYLTGLHEIGIFEAFRVGGLPARTPRLMEGDRELVLLFVLNRGPHLDAVMTFPILTDKGEWNTNWPLLPSFPLFLRNVLYTLGNIRDAAAEENLQPGQIKTLRPGPGIDRVRVALPDGGEKVIERLTRPDFPFGDTGQPGIYQAKWSGGGRRFAVNLLDSGESNLQPRDTIRLGAETISAGVADKRPWELWKWFIAFALAAVMLEWYVYNKRIYV